MYILLLLEFIESKCCTMLFNFGMLDYMVLLAVNTFFSLRSYIFFIRLSVVNHGRIIVVIVMYCMYS